MRWVVKKTHAGRNRSFPHVQFQSTHNAQTNVNFIYLKAEIQYTEIAICTLTGIVRVLDVFFFF